MWECCTYHDSTLPVLPPFPICATGACMFWNLPHTHPYLHALWVNPVTPRPSSFLFFPHPLQNSAIDADWRSCWGITTKRWRVCRQLKRRYWPSSVSQRVPLTGPRDKRKWASALYLILSRPKHGIFVEPRARWPCFICLFLLPQQRVREVQTGVWKPPTLDWPG